jgi:hypothetical protein
MVDSILSNCNITLYAFGLQVSAYMFSLRAGVLKEARIFKRRTIGAEKNDALSPLGRKRA